MGSAAVSPYAYCSNNPMNFVDPTGMLAACPYPPGWYNVFGSRFTAMTAWKSMKPVYDQTGELLPNFGLFSGSMKRWMEAHPEFYAQVRQNEYDAHNMYEYRNAADYDTENEDGTHTYKYWNVVTQSADTWTGFPGLTFHSYGNFGGPNYSAGQYQPESMTTDEQFKEVDPKDQTDEFFRDHDKSIRDNPEKTPTHDLVLAKNLITMSPFQKCYWLSPIPAPF